MSKHNDLNMSNMMNNLNNSEFMARNINGGTIFEKNAHAHNQLDDLDDLDSESSGEDMMRGLGSIKGGTQI